MDQLTGKVDFEDTLDLGKPSELRALCKRMRLTVLVAVRKARRRAAQGLGKIEPPNTYRAPRGFGDDERYRDWVPALPAEEWD